MTFQNSPDIHIITAPSTTRRYLVLIRAGSKSRPSFFKEMPSKDRSYDIAVNYYAKPHDQDILLSNADIVFSGGRSKMEGAKLLFEATQLHILYEGVFFLDDDVEILFSIDEFFLFCEHYALDLAQPALTADCTDAIGLTRQHPGLRLRMTNWVEIMAPFLRRNFLTEMLHSFDLSISGWGIDIYWGFHLGQRYTAGICDEFLMRHTIPSDHDEGAFYRYLRSLNVDPYRDMAKILDLIGCSAYEAKSIRHIPISYWFRA